MHGRTLATAAASLLLAAPGANAAHVTTNHRCYVEGDAMHVSASGFAAHAPLTVTLDGRVQRYSDGSLPSTDEAGAFASSLAAPSVRSTGPERTVDLRATDGTTEARARFLVTRPAGADFAPARGNPKRLRVRFQVWGFAPEGGRHALTYLHWVDPAGRVRADAALGRTTGACGHLLTRRRRVFPFAARNGRWTLVFDTHARYRVQADGPRAKIRVDVRPVSL